MTGGDNIAFFRIYAFYEYSSSFFFIYRSELKFTIYLSESNQTMSSTILPTALHHCFVNQSLIALVLPQHLHYPPASSISLFSEVGLCCSGFIPVITYVLAAIAITAIAVK